MLVVPNKSDMEFRLWKTHTKLFFYLIKSEKYDIFNMEVFICIYLFIYDINIRIFWYCFLFFMQLSIIFLYNFYLFVLEPHLIINILNCCGDSNFRSRLKFKNDYFFSWQLLTMSLVVDVRINMKKLNFFH